MGNVDPPERQEGNKTHKPGVYLVIQIDKPSSHASLCDFLFNEVTNYFNVFGPFMKN